MEMFIEKILNFIALEIQVFLVAALPVVELRGAIPLGIAEGMNPYLAALVSIAGRMLPVPFILLFMKPVFTRMRGSDAGVRIVDTLTNRTKRRSENIKKYSAYGLVLFVAMPLPTTGVWTGAMAASIFNIPIKRAFFAILLGDCIAAVIVMALSNALII